MYRSLAAAVRDAEAQGISLSYYPSQSRSVDEPSLMINRFPS